MKKYIELEELKKIKKMDKTESPIIYDSLYGIVRKLEEKYGELFYLCGEMVATLRIPSNMESFPKELNEYSERWQLMLNKIRNK